jgi:hypothetical protein
MPSFPTVAASILSPPCPSITIEYKLVVGKQT